MTQRLNDRLLRSDIPLTTKLTTIERLDCGFTKIIADAYLAADNLFGMSQFFKYMKPADPTKGYGYEVIGTGFPKGEVKLNIGEHLIARIHDQFPMDKKIFNNHFTVRQTYSKNLWYLDQISDPNEFLAKQMKAFAGSINNFLGFIMYQIFRNLSCQCQEEQTNYCEGTKINEYETYIQEVYKPSTSATNGIPFYEETLALEKVKPVNCDYKVTEHNLQTHVRNIRQRISTHKVCYCCIKKEEGHHIDFTDAVRSVLGLRKKIKEVVRDIERNCGKYKIDQTNQFNIAPHAITASQDLILIMNKEDAAVIDEEFPLIFKTANFGFDAASLGVAQVIYVPYVARGEAYILHKNVFQFIIDESEVGSANYQEHRVTNIWARMGFTFDLIDLLPAVVLYRKCKADCQQACPAQCDQCQQCQVNAQACCA